MLDLLRLLKSHTKTAYDIAKLEEYKGKYVAIDGREVIELFMSNMTLLPKTHKKNRIHISHLLAVMFIVRTIMEKSILPVFAFDDLLPAHVEAQESHCLTQDKKMQVKELLDCLGVPHVEQENQPAAALCAVLCGHHQLVKATSSVTTTPLMYGAPFWLEKLTILPGLKAPVYQVDLAQALAQLGITDNKFVHLHLIWGGVHGLKRTTGLSLDQSLKIIKEHKSLTKALGNWTTTQAPNLQSCKNTRDAIKKCCKRQVVDFRRVSKPNVSKVTAFLKSKEATISEKEIKKVCKIVNSAVASAASY
ncbi:hypothetical protein BC940DRAFT_73588 [Gongronella butleri]|nr:hypothetical protein BC940DRAFT_73588 [Gongronella butleri]